MDRLSGYNALDETSGREELLLDLLKQATSFYEDTIGIFSGIFQLSEYVKSGSPEEAFYAYIVNVLIERSRCKNASIFMKEGQDLVLKAAAGGYGGDMNHEVRIREGEGVAGRCALSGEPVLVSDTMDCEFFERRKDTRVSIGSMLCVPVLERDMVIGVLNLSHSQKGFFRVQDIRMYELMGLLVGQMLSLSSVYDLFKKEYLQVEEHAKTTALSLRDMSARYKAVVDSTEEMILLVKKDMVVFVNQALDRVLENDPCEIADVFDPGSLALVMEKLSELAEGQGESFEMKVSFCGRRPLLVHCFVKGLCDGQHMIMMRDITLKRRIEQKTMQTEKLTSLGLLTSGIAHEINNKLTPILGFADLVDKAGMGVRDKERFATIISSADAAKKIVSSLLSFSRDLPPDRDVFDVREVIESTVNLYRPTIKKRGIRVIYESPAKPLVVRANMNQIEQVIVNLVNNSIDALEGNNGNITIRSFLLGKKVYVEVEDTGPGIDEDILFRIFDPFFTTKSVDKGTGLGLSICYGIIHDNRGDISLENTGKGCIARIVLPQALVDRSQNLPGHRIKAMSRPKDATKSYRSRIMVVEDEEDLLGLMEDALGEQYQIWSFSNGQKAYEHMKEQDWELIISDLRMPEMDGMDLYRESIRICPDLKTRFLFITGDIYDQQVKSFFEDTGASFIRKPFRIAELQGIVQKRIGE